MSMSILRAPKAPDLNCDIGSLLLTREAVFQVRPLSSLWQF